MPTASDIQQKVYDLLSRASDLSFVSAEPEAPSQLNLSPGQKVVGQVVSNLPDGRMQVRIGADRFNMELPFGVRQGQNLELTFLNDEPRLTFAMTRQGVAAPPVSLSDASRLLSLLIAGEQLADPKLRSSLQSISDMLKRSSGDVGVFANLMDDVMVYGSDLRDTVKSPSKTPEDHSQQYSRDGAARDAGTGAAAFRSAALGAFENNASRILLNLARDSRFLLLEASAPPLTALPLLPGEEVNGLVTGSLPGGKTFVQVAGSRLEFTIPYSFQAGDILRLTYISSQPKPVFAFPRFPAEKLPAELSEAGRWLSILEQTEGGVTNQQAYVLEKLARVLRNLPPGSPVRAAINDEVLTYDQLKKGEARPAETTPNPAASALTDPSLLRSGNSVELGDGMAKLLQALLKGNRLALLEAINQAALPELTPGRQVRGEVIASLGGGRFHALVAGRVLEFLLPKTTKKGDLLNLFFVEEFPRPTFLLSRSSGGGSAQITSTANWLGTLVPLQGGTEHPREPIPLGLQPTGLTKADPEGLGRMLKDSVSRSGLFYESHLASWFGGDYPLDELIKEPQGRLSHLGLPMDPRAAGQAGADTKISGALLAETLEKTFEHAGKAFAHEGIADQRTMPVIREQLMALQTGEMLFRGELDPNRQFELRFAVRDERSSGRDRGAEEHLETSLDVSLPAMGRVTAKIRLNGNRLEFAVDTVDSRAAAYLASGAERFSGQLEAAGLKLAGFDISHAKEA